MNAGERLIKELEDNNVVITQTDTVWGILSTSKKSIEEVKGRGSNSNKKIIQFIDLDQIRETIPGDLLNLLNEYWPGPLTIIYEGEGYRMPNSPHILQALRGMHSPIYASSANLTSHPTVKSLEEAKNEFQGSNVQIKFLDIKQDYSGKYEPSTVYNYDTKQLVRKGPISEERIRLFIDTREKRSS